MLLTEKEASGKWCPSGARQCLGSGCMAWRWSESEPSTHNRFRVAVGDENATEEPPRPADLPADWVFAPRGDDNYAGWSEPDRERDERHQHRLTLRRGYCGLARAPEFD